MLHAPTSKAKTEAAQSKSPLALPPERELHQHAVGAAGGYSVSGAESVASVRSPEAQQRHTLNGMQSTYGNQVVLRMLHSPQQVARMPMLRPSQSMMLQRKCACGGSSESTGECAECKAKREAALQSRVTNQGVSPALNTAPPIVHDVLSSPGQPLDASTRAFMEPRFGHDFSQVRVHTDARAAESARAVNALAYTAGRNVVFGAGQYIPETMAGQSLLAHELAHVVQQAGNNLIVQRQPDGSDNQTVVEVPCPGTRQNFVKLTNEVTTPFGIGHPQNTGTCTLYLEGRDPSGRTLESPLMLVPGQRVDWYYAPQGAIFIAVVCDSACTGQGELTYDTPSV